MPTALVCQRRIITSAAAVMIGIMLLPWSAAAQQVVKTRDQNNNFQATPFNPCTQEDVFIQGQEQTRSEFGANRFRFRDHQQGNGFAVNNPNVQYNFQDITENEVVTNATTFTIEFEEREHLIREGKSSTAPQLNDDFFLRSRSRFVLQNGDVTQSRTVDRAECK